MKPLSIPRLEPCSHKGSWPISHLGSNRSTTYACAIWIWFHHGPVLFFKRILNFSKDTVARLEQRHAKRYQVSVNSPIHATLVVGDRKLATKVIDISSSGISIAVGETQINTVKSAGTLILNLEGQILIVAVKTAHVRLFENKTIIGLKLDLANFETKRSYLQLLEPIAIGQGLKPSNSQPPWQLEPDLSMSSFHGPGEVHLKVWRSTNDNAPQSFEFRMHECYVRAGKNSSKLDVFTCVEQSAVHKSGYRVPELTQADPAEEAEMLQLYRWVLPNLNQDLPNDVRDLMGHYA